jgi:hypothetical protein
MDPEMLKEGLDMMAEQMQELVNTMQEMVDAGADDADLPDWLAAAQEMLTMMQEKTGATQKQPEESAIEA